MAYYLKPDGQLAVAQIPKSGLRTMREWLNRFPVVKNDDAALLACPIRVMFIKNPITRVQSGYSFFNGLKKSNAKISHEAPLDNWRDYVDYILENEDEHWIPQVKHAGGLQTVVHRIEDIGNIFYRYHQHPISHINRSARVPVDNYRLADIVEYYLEDFNLWLGAEL